MPTSSKSLLRYSLLLIAVGCQLDDPQKPTVQANASPSDCVAPCTVNFTDISTGTGIYAWTYQWDFGDGNTSDQKNPSHTYTQAGTHQVKLTLHGKYGTASDSSLTVTVRGKVPVANFSISGGNCTAPCEVTFTNLSQNATSYLWTFGDGTASTQPNPTKTYNSAGKYPVKLTATGASGSHTKTDSVTILDTAAGIKADFDMEQDNTRSDSTKVKFINMSANATGYEWDFGDKITSTVTNPIHFYKRPGGKDTVYTVKLRANGTGAAFKEKIKSLQIKKP